MTTQSSSAGTVGQTTQPSRLIPRYAAREAGRRNTPEPIMLPITIDTAAQNPSTRGVDGWAIDAGEDVRTRSPVSVATRPHFRN